MIFDDIEIDAQVKNIRTMRLSVKRDGTPTLSIPINMPKERVLLFLQKNRNWLHEKIEQAQSRQQHEEDLCTHEYLEGEIFTFLGEKFPLHILCNAHATTVECLDGKLVLNSSKPLKTRQRMAAVNAWYMQQLQKIIMGYINKWLPLMKEKPLSEVRFRKMKSQWGSCAPYRRVLCFNTWLVFSPTECIEEVVVHELCHLKEASHNARFHALMEYYLPDYKERNRKLRQYFNNLR